MQSSELTVESLDSEVEIGWLERFGLAEKLPAALVFGCLLGLSAPTFGLHWLAWIGLVPLLVLLRGARGQVEAVLMGLIFGLGYHLVGLSWYLGLHPLGWLGLNDWLGDQLAAGVWRPCSLVLLPGLFIACRHVPGWFQELNAPFSRMFCPSHSSGFS